MAFRRPHGTQKASWDSEGFMASRRPHGLQEAPWDSEGLMGYRRPHGIQKASSPPEGLMGFRGHYGQKAFWPSQGLMAFTKPHVLQNASWPWGGLMALRGPALAGHAHLKGTTTHAVVYLRNSDTSVMQVLSGSAVRNSLQGIGNISSQAGEFKLGATVTESAA